jgi:hypothetical protein
VVSKVELARPDVDNLGCLDVLHGNAS